MRMKTLTRNAEYGADVARLRKRYGFTLVELLTVITIIGMLGAISITTVRGAVQSARETQTRTTVAKIDNVLTGIYEKYQYRRVEIDNLERSARQRAYLRTRTLRDLLRCDMPCTYLELDTESDFNKDSNNDYTPLQNVYRREVTLAVNNGADPALPNINAELLYLVVMNADPEARAAFSEREIADTDNNGLFEFVDGWGNPIRWMRWAPGLVDSDRQPACYAGVVTISDPNTNRVAREDADPFDPLSIIQLAYDTDVTEATLPAEQPGWFLVPYVYSVGHDGEAGLIMPEDIEADNASFMNDPFTYSRNNPNATAGSPDGPFYKDNIDNHTLVR